MKSDADLIVVGAGPAGSAAAIQAAQSGLTTILLEASPFPRHRPGETLHPGNSSIFQQLGVASAINAATDLRHGGIKSIWAGNSSWTSFDKKDDPSEWGYQIARAKLDMVLLDRARRLGVEIKQPQRALAPIVNKGRVCGVETVTGPLLAATVIDASGRVGWLQRRLSLPTRLGSPLLLATYGYCEGMCDELADGPQMLGDRSGWRWTAQVTAGLLAWVDLSFGCKPNAAKKPKRLTGLPDVGATRGADVSWRHVLQCAGDGFFIVGDAASVIDPAASGGVLRALMSGMMAAYSVDEALSGRKSGREAALHFSNWLSEWWHHDTQALAALYCELNPCWFQTETSLNFNALK